MGKVEDVLKSEIVRLARKATKETLGILSKDVQKLKRTVSQLSKVTAVLEKKVAKYENLEHKQKAKLNATDEEVKVSRFSPKLVKNLRKRLGITQAELALLAGVSNGAVVTWESGGSRPRGENKKSLVALRKLGRRDIKKLLAGKMEVSPKKKSTKRKTGKRKTAKRAKRKK